MEERRRALRLCALAGLAAAFPAWACTPALEGTRLESARHVLVYKPSSLSVSQHFSIDIEACAKAGPAPKTLKVDAHMPAHRHGMNYAPKVVALGPGRWRADGLMFHMPGKWELVFVVDGERITDGKDISFFDEAEKRRILSHGPWPPPARRDPSNRVSGKPEAIALGERLFFEPRLSGSGSVLCATCHAPFRAFQDGRPRGVGLAEVERNTPSLLNVAFYRWYGWDGGHDSLWSQSIRPLLEPREMNASPRHVASIVRSLYGEKYEKAFGRSPPDEDEALLVDAGKALAAFQETLVSGRTPFDDFRDALERSDEHDYPLPAQRGLKIFIGKGNCSVCHFGPHFTNGEFADTGIPFFVAPGKVDAGRIEGIKAVKASPFNLLGKHNDDPARTTAAGTRHVEAQHRNFGEFRVPGLRSVASTAPYMHNGSLATLADVVSHYSELNEERLHADGERILRPLRLTPSEAGDLLAFLASLSEKPPAQRK
ncbi:MAG TPA: cytochrome c peroxidase [Burkholderiales bacterium]|nr:cytochrome c peroxidase [Burkholderiales bacterium]